jgi:tetratricopeptide (TPR) repeat protein
MSQLAQLLRHTGDYAGAESLHRRALEARKRVLGLEDSDTLTSMSNLAGLLSKMGVYAEAEPLIRRALEGQERVLGPEHPETLCSVGILAGLLSKMGAPWESEPLYRRMLETEERVLGPEHPETLCIVNNLAVMLFDIGAYAEAEPLMRRALEGQERVLGPEHPETLCIVNNLAELLCYIGAYREAKSLMRRALEARERLLGPEHPATVASRQSLASLLRVSSQPTLLRRLRWMGERLICWLNRVSSRWLSAGYGIDDTRPLELRENALYLYEMGNYRQAATLLLRILLSGYEIPSTCCHLARIALMLDDIAAVRAHLVRAWSKGADIPPYVAPRLIWLELAIELESGVTDSLTAHSATVAHLLGRMKTAIGASGAHMEWSMKPVLDHLRSQVSVQAHSLLTALVAALSDRRHLAALDTLPAWREATPQHLE